MSDSLDSLADQQLHQRANAGRLRARRIVKPVDAIHVEIDGRLCTNFSSNNYLGLTHHPRVIAAAADAARASGVGAAAAGLISGFQPAHAACEAAIAKWKNMESAVLLPSGFQANYAAIQTLAALGKAKPAGVRFLVDKLAHASLLDAVRSADAPWRVIPHNGLEKLQRLLQDADADQLQVVVTESIFSMDGDGVDLAALAKLKQRHKFVLVLDEAHGSGVYGPCGAGLAAEMNLTDAVDVSIVTLSKAVGCVGGAVCGNKKFCDALLNFGRAYIYSTNLPPMIAAAIQASIAVMHDEPHRQRRVRDLALRVRTTLSKSSWQIPPGDSPIIPLIVGAEDRAIALSEQLLAANFLLQAVRPPTVARGASRLRMTLSCEHSDAEIDQLLKILGRPN